MQLSLLRTSAVVPAIASCLSDRSPKVRASAAAALAEVGQQNDVHLLITVLAKDKDEFVRRTAAYSLAVFQGTQRSAALTAALKDKSAQVRGAAAVALGSRAEPNAVRALSAALSDKDPFVRAQAARALGVNESGASQAGASLVKLLTSDPDSEVKRQAATALGRIGDRSALDVLAQAALDKDPYLAQAAQEAIAAINSNK
jgi:HEAT repeat protein